MRLPAFITDRLYDHVWSTMGSRNSDVDIGRDAYGTPYMQRWWAIPRNRVFNIYYHLYHHDDDRILHSHPWWSVSILLRGCLREFYTPTVEGANQPEQHRVRNVTRGGIVWRSPDMFHRLEVRAPRTITIFITGPNVKSWYFACKRGLMHWRDYGAKAGKTSGCGEDDSYPTNNH